jgi:hypothetical protein
VRVVNVPVTPVIARHKCGYCQEPITFLKLNSQISAGACITKGCTHTGKIHVSSRDYIQVIDIEGCGGK